MELKQGYKQTEVGVIPEEWDARNVGDIVAFSGGSQPPRSTFIFHEKDGYTRLVQIRDYKSNDFATYIPSHLVNKRCSADEIMIGRYGPPIFQILRGIEGAYNVALIKATPLSQIDREYLYYFLKDEKLFSLMEMLSQRSSGQTGVDLPALKSYPVLLPPLHEQRAIAAALSDVDALIASLDKLIVKKRDMKQAAMQELLTGKRRLPGFSGEWEVKRLGEIAEANWGNTAITKSSYRDYGYQAYSASGPDGFVDWYEHDQSAVLLSAIGAQCGKTWLATEKWTSIKNTIWFRGYVGKADTTYLYWFTGDPSFWPNRGQAQPFVALGDVRNVSILTPPLPEQIAIAAILSDMDTEIASLEQKRDKTRLLKQGMMQELLTGRIRLV